MIECLPRSLCTWDYTASGLASGPVTIEFDWRREQGRITGPGMQFEIRKEGLIDPLWTLEENGSVVARATKPSAMFRSFEITSGTAQWSLAAESPMTRVFELSNRSHVVGHFRPTHAFTRRATIDCDGSVPEPLQLFSFWLVALLWRRQANNAAASST